MKKDNVHTLLGNEENSIHAGRGPCFGGRLFRHEDLGGESWRFIDFWRIPPGTSIGTHIHHNGRELYYIIEGRATMINNDEEFPVQTGDMILNEPGDSHGFYNSSDEEVFILVTMVLNGEEEAQYENAITE